MITLTFSKAGADDVVLSENDLFDFDYEHSCFSGETFELGGVNARQLSLIIDNNGQWYHRGTFANSLVKLEVNGEHVATFNTENPKRRNGVIEIVAYDDITKLDTEYPTDYEFPSLFRWVYAQCLYEAGLVSSPTADTEYINNGVFNNGLISHEYTDYIYANSCRQLVSGMAEWNGGFCFINSDGRLQIQPFAKDVSKEFTSSELMDLDYSDEVVTFTKIKTSQKNKTYELGTDNGYTLVINNQYIQYGLTDEMFEMMMSAIYDYYNGFTLTPMSFTLAEPDFTLKLGDRISVYDEEEDVTVVGNISRIQMSGNLTMTITCGGFGNVGSASGYNPTSNSRINQAKGEIAASSHSFSASLSSYEYLSDTSIKFNDITYDISLDADGLIEVISDGESEFKPTKTGKITDVAFHNAVFTAIAVLCGLPKPAPDDTLTAMVQYRYNLDSYEWHNTSVVLTNQTGENNTPLVFTNAQVRGDDVYAYGNPNSCGIFDYPAPNGNLNECTVYLVAKCDTTGAIRQFHAASAGASFNVGAGIGTANGAVGAYAQANTAVVKSTTINTDIHVAVLRQIDNRIHFYVNGEYVGVCPIAAVSVTAGTFYFGVTAGQYSDNGGYHYYDFAFSETAHSEADIIKNSKYLMAKYNITS